MAKTVLFYTKPGCHLCEEAFQILLDVALDYPLTIEPVDITHEQNRDLEARYFLRIPVLATPGNQVELDWPFIAEDVRAYLSVPNGESRELL